MGEVRDDKLPHPATGDLYSSPVEPGSGWPGDPADEPGAYPDADADARQGDALARLGADISTCRRCPRLVAWREEVARTKRASYSGEPYWGRPIAGWGSPDPRVLIIGLAPAAHGANRTGRVFTGDRSGDWLFASLHRVGLANQPTSVHAADGLELIDVRMIATVRCAPPQNKPTTIERDNCEPWLDAELALVSDRVEYVVALGSFGWDAALRALRSAGWEVPRPKPKFGHGAEAIIGAPHGPITLLGCYHPSQQNTFTGKLIEAMLDDVLGRAAARR